MLRFPDKPSAIKLCLNRRTSECSEKFTSSLPSEEEECEANCRGAKEEKPVRA